MKTHYEVLGVRPTVDQKALQAAYYSAARKWHPDSHLSSSKAEAKAADEAMRKVNEAWAVLGDDGKRAEYDRQLAGRASSGSEYRRPTQDDDGVTRIDPRLFNRDYLEQRRLAQQDDISGTGSRALRVLPMLAIMGALALVFVLSAYAGTDGGSPPDPAAGPPLGAGIEVGDCIDKATGPSLIPRPCTATADGRIVGSRFFDSGECPIETIEELALANGRVACLGPLIGSE